MPLHLQSDHYNHVVHFPSLPSNLPSEATRHLIWGPSDIQIQSGTYLDAPANIWFHLPRVNLRSAERWCRDRNLSFLGPWLSHPQSIDSSVRGFGFSVPHFSRYRYVDTDSEDDAPDPAAQPTTAQNPPVPPLSASAQLHKLDQNEAQPVEHLDAQILSARHSLRQSQGAASVRNSIQSVPEQRSARRPRMSMAALDADEDMESGSTILDEHDDSQELDASDWPPPDKDLYSAAEEKRLNLFQPARQRHDASIDAPKLHMLRAALFEEGQADSRPYQAGRVDERLFRQDVKMEDIPGVNAESYEPLDPYELPIQEEDDDYERADLEGEQGEIEALPRERTQLDASFPVSALPFPLSTDSIAASKEGVSKDSGLMFGRSTRVALHRRGVLAQTMYGDTRGDSSFPSQGFCIRLDNMHATNYSLSPDWVRNSLRIHCDSWYTSHLEVVKTPEEIPKSIKLPGKLGAIKIPGLRSAFQFGIVADRIMEQFVEELKRCHAGEDENALHAEVAIWLLLALYKNGDVPGTDGKDTLLRRLALWGEGPAGTAFDEELPKNASLRKALLLLTIGDVEGAVAVAIESGNLRLALLMSRMLEVPKDELRVDSEAQLTAYGVLKSEDEILVPPAKSKEERWDLCLSECHEDAAVSVDERMILLILAGRVAPVARHLGLSWYRLFIMELLHGAGSSERTQAERVSDAVEAVTKSEIPTYSPHGHSLDTDVVYHLLRLYADPTAAYPLTSGVYDNGSFGVKYCPMDSRFSWLLHQVLSALIPQATTKRAPILLADAYSSQLRAMDMPLWAFYVLCTGGSSPDVLKNTLIQDWPQMVDDYVDWKCDELESLVTKPSTSGDGGMDDEESIDNEGVMQAEPFLTAVLGVPASWVEEAKAVAKYSSGDLLASCSHWISSGTEEGSSFAHDLIANEVFPDCISRHNTFAFTTIADLLIKLSTYQHMSNWSSAGGLILDYLHYVAGIPTLKPVTMQVLKKMVPQVCTMARRATKPLQHHAVSTIADGIATAQRALVLWTAGESRKSTLEQAVVDLERLPCSRGVKLRVAGEYKIEEEYGPAYAHRFASAFPPYGKFLDLRDSSRRNSGVINVDEGAAS